MAGTLITGAAGFIGAHLVRALINRGDEVHIVVRPSTNLWRIAPIVDNVRVHRVNMADKDALTRCFAKTCPKIVYHLGIQTRPLSALPVDEAAQLVETDLENLLRLLSAAAATHQPPQVFIRLGTLAEAGGAPLPYKEGEREQPLTPYAATMLAGTHFLSMLGPSLPFRVANPRVTLIYGPQQSTRFLIPLLVESCLLGKPIVINDPNARRDLLYVDDLVEALILLSEKQIACVEPINLCSGISYSMRQVAQLIVKATGASRALVQFGKSAASVGAKNIVGSPELAKRLLGWHARTPFEEGIRRMVFFTRSGLVHNAQ